MRRRSIGPRVADGAEASLFFGDRRQRIQQVAGGAGEPVESCHHQHVAGGELVEQAAKPHPVGFGAARHFAEHLTRPMLP